MRLFRLVGIELAVDEEAQEEARKTASQAVRAGVRPTLTEWCELTGEERVLWAEESERYAGELFAALAGTLVQTGVAPDRGTPLQQAVAVVCERLAP